MKQAGAAGSEFWAEFLPGIEKTIVEALAALEAREQTLPSTVEKQSGNSSQHLQDLRDRIAGLETVAARPEPAVAEVDALLQTGEGELRGYIAAVEALREKLAEWAGRAIG
jgi:hypothetical protein